MPKEETTVKVCEEIKTFIAKIQKEKNLEYFKEAHDFLLKLGYQTYEKAKENIEKGIESTTELREPITEEPSETQTPSCPYASPHVKQNKNGLEYLAYCDNPQKTNLPKDRLLPILACQKCWKRQSVETPDIKKTLSVNARCGWMFSISDPEDMKDLKETLSCFKDDKTPYNECPECPLSSKELRKLVIQKFL